MKDLLRKAWFFGLGVFDFTREKVEVLVQEMVQRGELSQQESPEVARQLWAKAQDAQQTLVEKIKELIDGALAEMNLARTPELQALERRVAALEDEVARLKVSAGASGRPAE